MKKNHIVKSISELKEICKNRTAQFYMVLNGNIHSTKVVRYLTDINKFYIHNLIDDSEQELSLEQIKDSKYTLIGEAIKKKAFIFSYYCD